jgi:methionyl-tRNA formyltransferase
MLDTIILLTGPAEAPILTATLRSNNPRLTVHAAASVTELDAIDREVMARARLIAFVTPVVVPLRILNALGYGAYNFHPGPPEYPGWAPSHFAIYDGAREFGATAHVMIERVDAGPIIATERFAIPSDVSAHGLQELAYARLAKLFWSLAKDMATRPEAFAPLPVRWSGRRRTRKSYAAMCEISADISAAELDRRIEAFGAGHFGLYPAIALHGHRFRYCAPDAAAPGIVPAPDACVQSSGNAMVLNSANAG